MHGLINKGLQAFLAETYGAETWGRIAARADLPREGFEALLVYDARLTLAMLDAAEDALGKSRAVLLEDFGTYLVSHPSTEPVRRLLRFGGHDFSEFLNSLDELPGRVGLAIPSLALPEIETREVAPNAFEVTCGPGVPDFALVLAGLLRAMADDYGALVLIDAMPCDRAGIRLSVQLLERDFSEGRRFELAREGGP